MGGARQVLILGGTAWLGAEVARQSVARGDAVTALARGQSGDVPAGVRLVKADRSKPDAYAEVGDQDWDDVVEVTNISTFAKEALAALAHRAKHWTFVSSISVYADATKVGADETAELVEPKDGGVEVFANAKVASEQATTAAIGERAVLARAGLIVGPGDGSDRFSYWVSRFAAAGDGDVLVPETENRHVQVIDVRDLASWILDIAENKIHGTFNVTGQPQPFADVLDLASRTAAFKGKTATASDDWLVEKKVNYWAGPRSLPLWLPATDVGMFTRSIERFRGAGGTLRPLPDTMRDTLADEQKRGLSRARRSGLTRGEELELLRQLKTS